MKPGSVIVDMAASALGGNVELSKPDETVVTDNGVTILAPTNLPATMPAGASQFYARNMSTFVLNFLKDGQMNHDMADEITAATLITRDGEVVQAATKALLEPKVMSVELLNALAIFVLAILVGFEVISKVPATLHTPLMSGANSIHGIVLVGAMLIAATADNPLGYLLAFVAMVFGAANVVGGYVVTDRMLQMFRKRETPARRRRPTRRGQDDAQEWIYTFVFLAWLAGAAAFVLGLHQMNSPATARGGNQLSAGGHDAGRRGHAHLAAAAAGRPRPSMAWIIIVVGFLIGGGIGLYSPGSVQMTAMPQLVSLFNAVGGGAAALVAIDDYIRVVGHAGETVSTAIFVVLGAVIGSVTFSRFADRAGQASGHRPGRPIIFPGRRLLDRGALVALAGLVLLVLGAAGVVVLTSKCRSSSWC